MPMLENAHPIVRWFLGESTLTEQLGHSPKKLLAADEEWWEGCHNHIQWAFPLREPSNFNPDAPLVTDEVVQAFNDYPILKVILSNLQRRFVDFLFKTRPHWVKPNDHNLLRITRAIISLRMFGLENEAWHVYRVAGIWACESNSYARHPELWQTTFRFWDEAMDRPQGGKTEDLIRMASNGDGERYLMITG